MSSVFCGSGRVIGLLAVVGLSACSSLSAPGDLVEAPLRARSVSVMIAEPARDTIRSRHDFDQTRMLDVLRQALDAHRLTGHPALEAPTLEVLLKGLELPDRAERLRFSPGAEGRLVADVILRSANGQAMRKFEVAAVAPLESGAWLEGSDQGLNGLYRRFAEMAVSGLLYR